MSGFDTQQQRLLDRLRRAVTDPSRLAELHAAGDGLPAAVVCELEMSGYVIERVHRHGRLVGVRLLDPEPTDTPDRSGAHRRRWRSKRP